MDTGCEWAPCRFGPFPGEPRWCAPGRLLDSRRHPQQVFRSCLGILRLPNRYGDERLEAPARRALAIGANSNRSVESILARRLDERAPAQIELAAPIEHDNIRNANNVVMPRGPPDNGRRHPRTGPMGPRVPCQVGLPLAWRKRLVSIQSLELQRATRPLGFETRLTTARAGPRAQGPRIIVKGDKVKPSCRVCLNSATHVQPRAHKLAPRRFGPRSVTNGQQRAQSRKMTGTLIEQDKVGTVGGKRTTVLGMNRTGVAGLRDPLMFFGKFII